MPLDASSQVLTRPQLAALSRELATFPPPTIQRGRRYAESGCVESLAYDDDVVRATVLGSDLYETAWLWNGSHWASDCTCPIGGYCKHAFAVGACVLEDHGANAPEAPAWNGTGRRLAPTRRASASLTAPETSEPRRPAARREPPSPLSRLRDAESAWQRHGALSELLTNAPVAWLGNDAEFQTLVEERDADLRCWRIARAVERRTGGWLPGALTPYRDRADLAARAVEEARDALLDEVTRWAAARRDAPARSLRAVLGLQRDGAGGVVVSIEARLTSAKLIDAVRNPTQLQQLRSELYRTPGLLPPAQASLLEWLTNTAVASPYGGSFGSGRPLTGPVLTSFLGRLANPAFAALATWSTELPADLAARGGVAPGGPTVFSGEAVRLVPVCVAVDGAPALAWRFVWPDGRDMPIDDALWIHRARYGPAGSSMILASGAFSLVVEEPPDSLVERFAELGTIELPAARRTELLALLAARFPHIAETIRVRTRVHRVRSAVVLDLRDDDWLQVRLFAHTSAEPWTPPGPSGEDVVVFEYAPDGRWVRGGGEAAAGGGSADGVAGVSGAAKRREQPADRDVAGASDLALIVDGGDRAGVPRGDDAGGDDAAGGPSGGVTTLTPSSRPSDAGGPTAGGPSGVDIAPETWLEAPEPDAVEPLVAWLRSLPARPGNASATGMDALQWGDRDRGWWMRASRRQMGAFAEAWEQRPNGVAYFGNARMRRLLTDAPLATPRVRVHASGVDWFAVSAEWEIEGAALSNADLAKLRSATTKLVRLDRGWVRRDAVERHDELDAMLADLGVEAGEGEQRVTVWQLAGARPETLAALDRIGGGAETVRALAELRERVRRFRGLPEVPVPAGFAGELRPYQRRGLDFLAYTSSLAIGALLADDMGLGKTVQALAWLEHLRCADRDGGPALVVCPASVVHNWAREAERFVPGLRVLLLTRGATRHALRAAIPDHDLIVTTYALLRRDVEAWRQLELRAVILDEAQNIKNPDAVVTRAALALRARHRVALTGTPLENRALDLWSLVSFVSPGYLGARARFAARFDRLDAPPHARALLAAKLRPLLLRRMKRDVATDLPARIEERRDCELTPGQRQLYLAELRRSRRAVAKLSGDAATLRQNKIVILAALTRLRQICCHPALAGGKTALGSGKFETLVELLEPILAEGHKVLLFSQFVQCLKLLRADLAARDVPTHLLTGETVHREAVVTAFAGDPRPCVFLISLKAGGTGLNLTSASYVVLFDPWWNPAVEAQAIDRTHRIGQDRTVIAYRLLSLGTIEEKIWELQQRKAALARDVLGEDGFARSLTRDDLQYLLADP